MSTHNPNVGQDTWFGTSRVALLIICLAVYTLATLVAYVTVQSGLSDNIVLATFIADILATLIIFLSALLFRNSSLYDPYWSVAPIVIVVFWASIGFEEITNPLRTSLVIALVSLWGLRLTYNCFRRWPNLKHEDFRYQDLRAKHGKAYWLVDLFGIELMPTVLVFLACLPLYPALVTSARPIGWLDGVALVVTLAAILVETIADQHLCRFLRSTPAQGEVCTTGLWRWSRHPNYFGEILFWWGLALFGLAAAPDQYWTLSGAVLITLLFVFISIPMMQERNRLRRPHYDEQVKGISVLIPWPRKA